MVNIYKTFDTDQNFMKIDQIEKGCWINISNPSEEELETIQNALNICPSFLRDPLDEEEKPRIDDEDDQILIIIDVPYVYETGKVLKFETIPLGIIVMEDHLITICSQETHIIELFKGKKVKEFYTYKKTRFTFQILYMVAKEFLRYLRHINKKTDDVEKTLHKSMRNKEIFKLLELEKSLVFFATSLKSNEAVMEKLLRGKCIKMYEEDEYLLEEVIIENKQAIEMANIYSTILNGMMEAFASVISNNLNIVMKFLTSVTIVLAIPTMVSSFFGMNLRLPWAENSFGFFYVVGLSVVASLASSYILYKRGMF